jgi:hypothetical protein
VCSSPKTSFILVTISLCINRLVRSLGRISTSNGLSWDNLLPLCDAIKWAKRSLAKSEDRSACSNEIPDLVLTDARD